MLLAGALSCDEPTSASRVAHTSSIQPMTLERDVNFWPTAHCDISIHVKAANKGVVFRSGRFTFFTGPTRNAPVSESGVNQNELGQSFGGDVIVPAGDSAESVWDVYAGLAFEVSVVLKYEVDGALDSLATDRMACGPLAPSFAPNPPSLSQLSFTPAGEVQPGQDLRLSWSVAGTSLWATDIRLAGSFAAGTVSWGELLGQKTESYAVTVPSSAKLGAPVTATLFAFDAFGTYGYAQVNSGQVADNLPPTVIANVSPGWGQPSTKFRGNYFTDDTLSLFISASDASRVARVLWDVLPGTYKDSMEILDASWFGAVKIRPSQAWLADTGKTIRVTARDAVGHAASVVLTQDTSFRVVPSVSRPTVLRLVGTGGDEIIDPSGTRIFVARGTSLTALDANTLDTVFTVPLGATATAIDLTASGDTAVVTLVNPQSLGLIDLRGASHTITNLTLPGGLETIQPWALAVAANGKAFAYSTRILNGAAGVIEVDLATGVYKIRTDVTGSGALRASPERDIIVHKGVFCAQVYTAATDSFGPCKSAGRYGLVVPTISRAPHVIAVHRSLYDTDLNKLRDVLSMAGPVNEGDDNGATTISPDGQFLYHRGPYPIGVARSRSSDGALLDRTVNIGPMNFAVGKLFPDGTRMYYRSLGGAVVVADLRDSLATPRTAPNGFDPLPAPRQDQMLALPTLRPPSALLMRSKEAGVRPARRP
jgi:hypothetical protein